MQDEYSPKHLYSHHKRGPFKIRILYFLIYRKFEKPSKLEFYDNTNDPENHVEHIDTVLNYH